MTAKGMAIIEGRKLAHEARTRKDWIEAERYAAHAVLRAPDDAETLAVAGTALMMTPFALGAVGWLTKAYQLAPEGVKPNLLHNLGIALCYSGDMAAGLGVLSRAPRTPQLRYDWGRLLALDGDWHRGLQLMEARRETLKYPDFGVPEWDGEVIESGDLWVHADQGHGDMIMNMRFLRLIANDTELVVSAPKEMHSLFSRLGHELRVASPGEEIPDGVVAHVPMSSLAHICGVTPDRIPRAPRALERVGYDPRSKRVGICWRGATNQIPFRELRGLLGVGGVEWICLQQSLFLNEQSLSMKYPTLSDWEDTLREIASCNLVITVDTAIAHLAGTVGVPTWLLLPKICDWRWLMNGDRTEWYPSMQIIRQAAFGDWSGPLSVTSDRLLQWASVIAD